MAAQIFNDIFHHGLIEIISLDSSKNDNQQMRHERLNHLYRFYVLLARLEDRLHGVRRLSKCSGRMDWPGRGLYFFQETDESRSDTGNGPRIVRVGTHALKTGSRTKLAALAYTFLGSLLRQSRISSPIATTGFKAFILFPFFIV